MGLRLALLRSDLTCPSGTYAIGGDTGQVVGLVVVVALPLLLAHLVGPHGTVHGVEVVERLVEFGRSNLRSAGMAWASITLAEDGVLGRPDEAPYDRILVSAEPDELPQALVDQLADDGVLVIPVAGTMLRVTNPGAVVGEHGRYRFVPLR